MIRLPPLIGLRVFEAAARNSSFKHAAEELGVTPTAISHQIRLLEDYCGQRLFRRQPRPLSLTGAGEKLYPAVRDSLVRMSLALEGLSAAGPASGLRVTTTTAFAARWLLPRLPLWRQAHPDIPLDIISTYAVLDLNSGEADVAIRYARNPPTDGEAIELFRDTFCVVASPALVGTAARVLHPSEIATFARIETGWPSRDVDAPTWLRWEQEARIYHSAVPRLADTVSLRFEEENHAIDAAIAGQGIAICSDVLISSDIASGRLKRVSDVTLTGYGFYVVYSNRRPLEIAVHSFAKWAQEAARTQT